MAVEIERTFRVLNSEGWWYEVAEVEGGVEIRYFEPNEASPSSKVFVCDEDFGGIAVCFADLIRRD